MQREPETVCSDYKITFDMESATWTYNLDTTPNYSYIFDFESEFIHQNSRKWMTENWTVAFYYVGVYMAFIFGGQYYMQNRPR